MQNETIVDSRPRLGPIRGLLATPDLQHDILVPLLDYIDYPILVVKPDGLLMWSNQQGQEVLTERQSLVLRDERIVPAHESYLEQWQQKLLAAGDGDESLMFVNDGRFGQAISINPLRADYLVIILGRSHPCKPLALRRFSGSFKLTPAEQRVVAQLMAGQSPSKIAQANSVAEATIRTQIKSVLAKTGVASIRDLILALSRLPPVNMIK